jgi:hypothetical protein
MNDVITHQTNPRDDAEMFGANFKELKSIESYYPTRFEYMFGKALQGLVVGRADKDISKSVRNAILLAEEAEEALDKAQD